MKRLLRKMLLGTASVLALGIAGTALDYAADAGNSVNTSKMSQAARLSDNVSAIDSLRKDDIRWAQVELRNCGLYNGSLDGILGPETKRAIGQFQMNNGLIRTAALDAQTWEALTSGAGIGQGSSTPQNGDGAGAVMNPPASDLGR